MIWIDIWHAYFLPVKTSPLGWFHVYAHANASPACGWKWNLSYNISQNNLWMVHLQFIYIFYMILEYIPTFCHNVRTINPIIHEWYGILGSKWINKRTIMISEKNAESDTHLPNHLERERITSHVLGPAMGRGETSILQIETSHLPTPTVFKPSDYFDYEELLPSLLYDGSWLPGPSFHREKQAGWFKETSLTFIPFPKISRGTHIHEWHT